MEYKLLGYKVDLVNHQVTFNFSNVDEIVIAYDEWTSDFSVVFPSDKEIWKSIYRKNSGIISKVIAHVIIQSEVKDQL